jgi:hypothetical protein
MKIISFFPASREGHDDLVNLLVSQGKTNILFNIKNYALCSGADVNRTTEDTQETACIYIYIYK